MRPIPKLREPRPKTPKEEPTGADIADQAKREIRALIKVVQYRRENGWLYPYGLNYNHLIDWHDHPGARHGR